MQDAENEDAWYVAARPDGGLLVAVADGATERAFSRVWAQALAEAACASGSVEAAHARAVGRHARHVEARRATLPWYALEKADEGAFAALLVVQIDTYGGYRAEAVGDACLFEIDATGRRRAAWPLDTPEAFAARPVLLASNAAPPAAHVRTGRILSGGALLVATDALAAHLVARPDILWPPSRLDPAAAVEAARADAMRNDDTTWVRIAATAPPAISGQP